jgi:hypothetical protein
MSHVSLQGVTGILHQVRFWAGYSLESSFKDSGRLLRFLIDISSFAA